MLAPTLAPSGRRTDTVPAIDAISSCVEQRLLLRSSAIVTFRPTLGSVPDAVFPRTLVHTSGGDMSSRRHHPPARARSRRRTRSVEVQGSSCLLWIPHVDSEPVVVATILDAIELVFELFEMPMREAALMMLDARRRLVAVILDPPPEIECLIGWAQSSEVAIDFCQSILVVFENDITDGPPSEMETVVFDAMSQQSLEHDVLLLDMILANPDKVRSMAFATDPNCVWTEPFDP